MASILVSLQFYTFKIFLNIIMDVHDLVNKVVPNINFQCANVESDTGMPKKPLLMNILLPSVWLFISALFNSLYSKSSILKQETDK